jgi:hypothetical protein
VTEMRNVFTDFGGKYEGKRPLGNLGISGRIT